MIKLKNRKYTTDNALEVLQELVNTLDNSIKEKDIATRNSPKIALCYHADNDLPLNNVSYQSWYNYTGRFVIKKGELILMTWDLEENSKKTDICSLQKINFSEATDALNTLLTNYQKAVDVKEEEIENFLILYENFKLTKED